MASIFQDWGANKGNIKGKIILLAFRTASIGKRSKWMFIIWIPYLVFYRLIFEWILGVELPYKLKAGKGLILFHGQSLVVNDGVVIGDNCTIRHCTTIGNKGSAGKGRDGCPVIGNQVDIGANVCIIGNVVIGDNVIIGAGTVVVKDIPSNCMVVGNPARIIKKFN